MRNIPGKNKKIAVVVSVVLMVSFMIFLSGCFLTNQLLAPASSTPTTTLSIAPAPLVSTPTPPTSGISDIFLPGGSKIVVRGNTFATLPEINLPVIETDGLVISIQNGELLVDSLLPSTIWFTVTNPNLFIARVTAGTEGPDSIMVVLYQPSTGQFVLDCIKGICQLGPNLQELHPLQAGEQGWLSNTGAFSGPYVSIIDQIREIYDGNIPEFIQTAVPTPFIITATPDIAATATASCKTFHEKFPATPCP